MNKPQPPSTSNFIKQIIEADLASGKHKTIVTRFPPEPNGYLHFGHAKAIFLNFGLAQQYGGKCNLRFDDTNPEKEEQEYVDSILEMVKWLGFDYGTALYASDYFDFMYQAAELLISEGHAYVDSQTAEEVQLNRGTFTEPGKDSPHRERRIDDNLALFREMRDGKHADGAHVLRAKIDMTSPNINLRDPTLYRIKRAKHHRTGDKWCIYPLYTYAHPIEDAVEGVTHSLCTLEFEDQRPFYDWLLNKLADGGLLRRPLPQQIEFARVNLTHVILSKRKLIQLVEEGHVEGWDDPRMPTLAGARRRGYTPEGFKLFAERIGVSKASQMIDFTILEDCMREHLNEVAPRRMAVLDPVKLVMENYPDEQEEMLEIANHPQKPEMGKRTVPFSRELWVEREDYQEVPATGYFRLYPGNTVRLRHGYVVKCMGYDKALDTVKCIYYADSKSGTEGANKYKVKGNIHWVSVKHAFTAGIRSYDRLFKSTHPDDLGDINPASKITSMAQLESSLRETTQMSFQFERHGYYVVDSKAPRVFNRTVSLRDSWASAKPA